MEVPARKAGREDVPVIVRLYLEVAEDVVAREPSLRHVPWAPAVGQWYGSRIDDADRAVLSPRRKAV